MYSGHWVSTRFTEVHGTIEFYSTNFKDSTFDIVKKWGENSRQNPGKIKNMYVRAFKNSGKWTIMTKDTNFAVKFYREEGELLIGKYYQTFPPDRGVILLKKVK